MNALTALPVDKARQEFEAACRELTQAQLSLDAARRYMNSYRRQVARALPFAYQQPQRDEHDERALKAVQQGIARVDAAKLARDEKYEALTDKTDADGWS